MVLSPREGAVEQVLADELLWLSGSCKCLCGNHLRMGPLRKQGWMCR